MCTFDPTTAPQSMAPGLSDSDRLTYISKEIDFIDMLLEMAEDCKWIYQALIECTMLASRIRGSMEEQDRERVRSWLEDLKKLDPLRKGRWQDLEKQLNF
jgi:geranylgeranyl transferase type-2 subunit alpha